jgi:hypothetical protein
VLILSIVFLTALTFVVRIWFPVGKWVFPKFQLAHFVHYAFSYFAGVLAYRGNWFNRLGRAQARSWGIVALIMLPIFFVPMIISSTLEGDAALAKFSGGLHWQSFVYADLGIDHVHRSPVNGFLPENMANPEVLSLERWKYLRKK